MIEKIGTIKNPLTIIAMFAGIAEISGAVVLPFICQQNQGLYIWFLMLFPLLLILLFFATLNFNHKVLYAPSDFRNDDSFLQCFSPASSKEQRDKQSQELKYVGSHDGQKQETASQERFGTSSTASYPKTNDLRSRYSLAEDLALSKIATEMRQPVLRNMRFARGKVTFIFDGIIISNNNVIGIEVKYIHNTSSITKYLRDSLLRILYVEEGMKESMRKRFSLMLAIVTDTPRDQYSYVRDQVTSMIGVPPYPIEVRIYGFKELQSEFNVRT